MQPPRTPYPVIIPRSRHSVSRRSIDPDALKVLYRLQHKGYKAYLVGGSVRDLLLGKTPKDFDVGTNAHPSEIRRLFRNCRIIGRRFPIAHIYFGGGKIIEVSTFRREAEVPEWNPAPEETPMTANESVFGEPHEDALRRDLTINGLFYDIATFSVVDYVGGIADLRDGVVRAIGNPDAKFLEDPVRMIRTIRHAARTGFIIEEHTYGSILKHAHLITGCNKARLLDELRKDLVSGYLKRSLQLLYETGLLKAYFLDLALYLEARSSGTQGFYSAQWIWSALDTLDQWTDQDSIPMTLFYVPFLFPLLEQSLLSLTSPEEPHTPQHQTSTLVQGFLKDLSAHLALPKRDVERLTMLWIGIDRLERSMEGLVVPVSLQKKPYFQHLISVFRLKWIAAGHSPEETDTRIQKALSKGRRLAIRHEKRRKTRRPRAAQKISVDKSSTFE